MVLEAPEKSTSEFEPVWAIFFKYRKLLPKQPQEPIVLHSFPGPHELVAERQKPRVPYLITFHLLVNKISLPDPGPASQSRPVGILREVKVAQVVNLATYVMPVTQAFVSNLS